MLSGQRVMDAMTSSGVASGRRASSAQAGKKCVSGGIASAGCASTMSRNSVVPDRGAPTMTGISACTGQAFAGRIAVGLGMKTRMGSAIRVDVSSLRVLLTNITLTGRTGTEIVTRDLALGLLRRGHRPMVYAPEARGGLADELRAASVPVADDIDAIAVRPDVIHGHHNAPLATAIARFPEVPAIFVCHDFTAWHDAPPHFPSIRRYVAIDDTNADRLVAESGIEPERVAVHLNAVDLRRFAASQRRLPDAPARALAFVKHITHLTAVRAACAARGIALDTVGTAAGVRVDAPETVFAGYDLVFTSALSALEAMACGCAVIVCDARGVAGFRDAGTIRALAPAELRPAQPDPAGHRGGRSAPRSIGTIRAQRLRYPAWFETPPAWTNPSNAMSPCTNPASRNRVRDRNRATRGPSHDISRRGGRASDPLGRG